MEARNQEPRRIEVILRWLDIYAAHYGYNLVEEDVRAWKMALAGIHPDDLETAFLKTMKELKDRDGVTVRPRAGDVLARVVKGRRPGDRKQHIIPRSPDECFEQVYPAVLGSQFLCGCREHAPYLWCQHDGCNALGTLNDEGKRLQWCHNHARLHDPDLKAAEKAKGDLRSMIQRLADDKSMSTGGKDGEVEEVHIP